MGLLSFLFGHRRLTDSYVGRHGEFDRNDEDLDIMEDMLSMDVNHEDADLEEHYGWDNVASYESEGLDEYADDLRDDEHDRDDYDDDRDYSFGGYDHSDDGSSDYGYGGDYGDSDW